MGFQASYAQVSHTPYLPGPNFQLTFFRNLETLVSRTSRTAIPPTSTALAFPLTGMNLYVSLSPLPSLPQALTLDRTWPSTFCPSTQSPPRSVVMLLQVSARRLALLGRLLLLAIWRPRFNICRFESRDIAERVIKEYHSVLTDHDGVKLFLRFADTKAQKQLKQQSQERRNWRSREYSYSVEHTPSPTLTRLQNVNSHISPASYQSPAGASNGFTPATSVSPA